MSARSHNIAVGLTVLVGLGLLGGMILIFAGMPAALQGGYTVHVRMADTGGAKIGDTVLLRGLPVGKLTDVAFAGADPSEGVDLTLHIDRGIKLPKGTTACVSQPLLGGGVSIGLTTGAEKEYLPTDNSAAITGVVSGFDFGKIAQSVDKLSQGLGTLLGTEGAAAPTSQSATAPAVHNLQTTINRLDVTLASLNEIIANKQNQENIRLTLENVKNFTESGTKAMDEIRKLAITAEKTVSDATVTVRVIGQSTTQVSDNVVQLSQSLKSDTDRLTQGLLKDTEDISKAMNSLDRAIAALSSGQGTTGKLITDPHLYNNLVDIADQMSHLLKETREMLQQWKDKGVPLKLK